MGTKNNVKNLFKWIGGKKWLSKELRETFKNNISNKSTIYIEPFSGGLGSFLSMLPEIKNTNIEKIILNDLNKVIVLTYTYVKLEPYKIFEEYKKIEDKYKKTVPEEVYSYHKTKDKDKVKSYLEDAKNFYLKQRKRFNELKLSDSIDIELSAIFLFLTEHCFNGIYRENSKGEFNSPFNWDNKKYVLEYKKESILYYHKIFNENNIIFENLDVFELLEKYNNYNSSFLYLDPPYLNESKSENKYNSDHFGRKEQIKLLEVLSQYHNYIYSNHLNNIFIDYFNKKENREYKIVKRKNIVSADKSARGELISEIIGIQKSSD